MRFTMQGWIKLHRSILEWEWYDHQPTRDVFIHLLLKCQFQTTSKKRTDIPQGCVLTSRSKLAKELGISERSVRTALSNLQTTSEVSIKVSNKNSLIYLNKWEDYQQNLTSKTTSNLSAKRPASDQLTSSPKNDKEEKNIYTKISSLTDEVVKEVATSYRVLPSDVKKKVVEIRLYCESTGKRYKNYRSALMNWVRRDLESGKIEGNILIRE